MKPCYALLSSGSYVALHHAHWLAVIFTDGLPGFDVVCGAPGQEDLHYLYSWTAYHVASEETDTKTGAALSVNEVAANEMLVRLMAYLSADLGGLVVIDDLATDIVQELGLEAAPEYDGPTRCPGCGELYTSVQWKAWEDWQSKLAGDYFIVGIDGSDVSIEDCCEPCADAYFTDDTCTHRTADGSMEVC